MHPSHHGIIGNSSMTRRFVIGHVVQPYQTLLVQAATCYVRKLALHWHGLYLRVSMDTRWKVGNVTCTIINNY
jgi:hypothetical protein